MINILFLSLSIFFLWISGYCYGRADGEKSIEDNQIKMSPEGDMNDA